MKGFLLQRASWLCLILSLALILSSCSFFQDYSPNGVDPDSLQDSENIDALHLVRNPDQVTLLIALEGTQTGSLSSLFLCKLDSQTPSFSVLQLPTDTYSRAGGSIGSYFTSAFATSILDGNNTEAATEVAISNLKSLLQNSLLVSIDYTVYLTQKQLASVVDTVGGIDLTLPSTLQFSDGTSLSAGVHTVTGDQVLHLLQYNGFSSSLKEEGHLDQILFTAILSSLKSNIDSTILSLCVLELRNNMTSDVPTTGGSDLFIIKKLIAMNFSDLQFARVGTQSVVLSAGTYQVLNKANALGLVNDFLALYTTALTEDQFDPNIIFGDSANSVVGTVYYSSATVSDIVTGSDVHNGKYSLS